MTRRTRLALLGSVALALSGCSEKRATKAETGEVSAPSAPTASALLELRLDGKVERAVSLQEIGAGLALSSLLPKSAPDAWHGIEVRGGKRVLRISPELYPGASIEVRPGAVGIDVGLYRPVPADAKPHVKAALAKPVVALEDASSVEIRTAPVESNEPAGPTAVPTLLVEGTPHLLDGERLKKLPTGMPFRTKKNPESKVGDQWELRSIVATAAPLNDIATVRLHSASKSLSVSGEALSEPSQRHLLKRNRRGLWVYRSFKEKSPGALEELRGIIRIEIER